MGICRLLAIFISVLCALFLFPLSNSVYASFVTFQGGFSTESAWRAAVGSYSIETFEGFAAGSVVTTLPSIQLEIDPLVGSTQPDIYVHSVANTPPGAKQLPNFALLPELTPFKNLDIVARPTAGTNIFAFGFWNGDPQGHMVVRVFDELDNQIGTIAALINSGSASALSSSFAGFISSAPIGRLEFEGSTGGGFNHVDDFQVSFIAPVPVPAAFWLFGSGLLGMAVITSDIRYFSMAALRNCRPS